MEEYFVNQILDRYEKAIESLTQYKSRVDRHEDNLRKSNKEIQQLRTQIRFLETKIDELKTNI